MYVWFCGTAHQFETTRFFTIREESGHLERTLPSAWFSIRAHQLSTLFRRDSNLPGNHHSAAGLPQRNRHPGLDVLRSHRHGVAVTQLVPQPVQPNLPEKPKGTNTVPVLGCSMRW